VVENIQYKDNGRLEPAAEREIAFIKGKPFKCTNPKCGIIQRIENVEFGAVYRCESCGSELTE
jgi:predicted RNA-binding Zn-ribbon protein involved in translation (DUF1610 family)